MKEKRRSRKVGFGVITATLSLLTLASSAQEYFSGYVYQSGRNGKITQTTSHVTLPNLNEILAPTPVAKPRAAAAPTRTFVQQPQKTISTHRVVTRSTATTTPQQNRTNSITSSVPTGPTGFDALTTPVDPGYDNPAPVPATETTIPQTHFEFPKATIEKVAEQQAEQQLPQKNPEAGNQIHYHLHTHTHTHHHYYNNAPTTQPQVQSQPQATQPQQITPTPFNPYPFAHNYSPRTYYYSFPRTYYSYPYNFGRYYYFGRPYSIFRSRAPLRGSLTSSRNYLSGIRRAPSFRFIF